MKNLYLIIGRSGSGKDTIVNTLCHKYFCTKLVSYTTRQPRDEADGNNHRFTTKAEYEKAKKNNVIIAETYFDGNYYWATREQAEKADFYIIDPRGAYELMRKTLSKPIIPIYIDVSLYNSTKRMLNRAKSKKDDATIASIIQRSYTDLMEFNNEAIARLNPCYVSNDGDLCDAIRQIETIIKYTEGAVA